MKVVCTLEVLVIFANQQLQLVILNFAKQRLTSKQKKILKFLKTATISKAPITRLVNLLSNEINSSKSSIWLNLKQLKNIKLITYGDQNSKGLPVKLTAVGKWIARNINNNIGGKQNE